MSKIKMVMRKIQNAFSKGKVLELKPGKVATIKANLMADEVFEGLEFPQQFGFVSFPPKDSEILAAFLGGNRDHGTVLNAFKRDLVPDTLEEGEICLYNIGTAKILLDKNSNIKITTGDNLTIEINQDGSIIIDSPSVTYTGAVNIIGDLTVTTINGAPA